MGVAIHSVQAAPVTGDALVLVNSQSAKYLDFQHFIQPYLDNFGIPYRVQDISTNAPGPALANYALIIIGHSQLDTNFTYLNTWAQFSILQAVTNGTGLVSFDGDLSSAGAPRYPFVQDIFGFSYGPETAGTSVSLPPTEPSSQMHYITARHPTSDLITCRSSLALPGLTVPPRGTVLALCGGEPLVAVTKYGQGRAVQWSSYGWMTSTVLGPVAGLDDLVWRGVVWAGRKPFVMRGLPHFVTMRVDDVAGPLDWVHAANAVGFKPLLALFISNVVESSAADLKTLTTNGQATACIHSFDCCKTFFYFNHSAKTANSDLVQSNHFYLGTQWFASHGIPMSKVCATHYSEIGVNCFAGLKDWGIEFVPIEVVPGTVEYGTPPASWLVGGPYRLYETPQPGLVAWATYYADWLVVPGHPEFDGQFFNVYSELRDVAGCGEWCPNNDVAGSINRGTQMAKRALDSMTMATIFSHESFIMSPTNWVVTPTNWQAILQGITNNLASYDPLYVTVDHASQYVRATRTSRLMSSAYDPELGKITATFSGRTDLDTQVRIFLGEDNSIVDIPGAVPVFSESFTNPVVVFGPPVIIEAPESRTNNAGTAAMFNVRASGGWPLGYQWYRNGTNALNDGGGVSGAATDTLVISNVLKADAGSYTVVITNTAGGVNTLPGAVLTVIDPAIASQPADQASIAGATVVFSVEAGATAPAYQWFKNGIPISGATTTTLSLTNVSAADAGSYSMTVSNAYGTVASSNAILTVFHVPTAADDAYEVAAGTPLTVPSPGVLANDVVEGAAELKASLVTGPIHGVLELQDGGGFTYSPLTNYVGKDSFVYEAVNGPAHSGLGTVTLTVTAGGVLFSDDFTRLEDPGPMPPWLAQMGSWTVSGGVLRPGTNMSQSYGYARLTNSWTDYAVEGRLRFLALNAWGGGLGGRLNPTTGAHYAAWIYPDASPGGGNVLWLIKFQTWTSYSYGGSLGVPMGEVPLGTVGTNWHTLKLAFRANQIAVDYDGTQVLSVTDTEAQPYVNGGISVGQWVSLPAISMLVDKVMVRPLVVEDSYSLTENTALTVSDSGVLENDTAVYPTNLVSVLVSGVAHGKLNLSPGGGFTYSPGIDYYGMDSFTYEANQGENSLGTATVTITVTPQDPKIIKVPSSSTNNVGTTAMFTSEARGTAPLSYQWFWNGTNILSDGGRIGGAGTATLTISDVLGGDVGSYTVVVSNPLGTVTSTPPAFLTVIDPLVVNAPASLTNCPGTSAGFIVEAIGTALSYQWYKGALPLPGQTSASLTLSNVSAADAGSYGVVVSGTYGSVTNGASLTVNESVAVVSAPVSVTNCPGTIASFSVSATGTGLSYQWYKGGSALAGRTGSSLVLSNVSAADVGSYSVVVSGVCGSVTNSANLTVNESVAVVSAPVSVTNCPGTIASFSVGATGTGLSYQWYKGGSVLAGQTGSSLVLADVSAADGGSYEVVVSGACGAVTNGASLTVNESVAVVSAPASVTNCPGTSAGFSVGATGTGLSYQWYKGGSVLAGETGSSLVLADVSAADGGSYEVVVSGACGAVTNGASLTVNESVAVVSPPVSRTNYFGTTASFSVNATGTGLSYQWYKGGSVLTGQTGSSLVLANVGSVDAGTYRVVVSGACGGMTTSANLTVIDPILTSTPASRTNLAGTVATFSTAAIGTLPLTYQWFWNGTNVLKDGGKIGGAQSAMLVISNALGADMGSYAVVVSNGVGIAITSPPAVLTVIDPIITSQPLDQTNGAGSVALFSVGVRGTSPRYQWFKGVMAINGATNSTLTVNVVSEADEAGYSVVVSNLYGSVTSRVADLMFVPEPKVLAVETTNGIAVITWSSFAGQLYRLQYKDGPGAANWQDTLPDILATGPITTTTNALGSATQRFYRVVLASTVPPPLVITSLRVVNGSAIITWDSVAGQKYRLQYKNSLADGIWMDMPPDIIAIGSTTTVTNVLGITMHRFYRVTLAPALTPPFAITSVRGTNGIAIVTWNSVAGQTYRLQYKSSLADTTWQDALPDVLATGSTTTLTNALGSASRRFYRVMLVETGVSRPVIKSIRMANRVATVVWSSVLNQSYRLQYKDSLESTNWNSVGLDVVATGPTTAMTHNVGGALRRFYRVALAP